MRITLTIDEDVADRLEQLRKERKQSLRDLVNEALRRGLVEPAVRSKRRRPFRTRSMSLGRCLVGNLDCIGNSLALADGESCP